MINISEKFTNAVKVVADFATGVNRLPLAEVQHNPVKEATPSKSINSGIPLRESGREIYGDTDKRVEPDQYLTQPRRA